MIANINEFMTEQVHRFRVEPIESIREVAVS
jgi:hypothetical protein